MSQATGGAGTWWIEAFPHWEPIADHVPVGPREAVHLTSPENRVETVLEIASQYRAVSDLSLGELYPLVPARFPLRVSPDSKPTTFAAVAAVAAVDVLPIRSRQAVREIHLTLAQANAAAAWTGAISWPSDDILSAVGSAVFSLYPTDFYALIDVAIGGRDHADVEAYAARELDVTDIGAFIRDAAARAHKLASTPTVEDWISGLHAFRGRRTADALVASHPQLLRKIPLLPVTLMETVAAIDPGLVLDGGALESPPDGYAPIGLSARDRSILEWILEHPDATLTDIGRQFGIPTADVNRVLRSHSVTGVRNMPTPTSAAATTRTPGPTPGLAEKARPVPVPDSASPPPAESEPAAPQLPDQSATPTPSPSADLAGPPPSTAPATAPASAERSDVQSVGSLVPLESNLDTWEEVLAPRFEGAVLAADVDLSEGDLQRLLDTFGERYRLARGRHTTTSQFIRLYPAATLAALVGMASVGFEHNTYWSKFWERLEVEYSQTDENSFRQNVQPLLKNFDLDPIDGLPSDRHVQRLTIHAGIPASSFGKLLDALTTYVALVDNQEDRPFPSWIVEPSHEALYDQLDASIRIFIEHSGPRGKELLSTLASIVASVADGVVTGEAAVAAAVGSVPELIRVALRDAFLRDDIGEAVRARRRSSRMSPTLHLGSDDAIVVRLPAPIRNTSSPWAVTLDSEVVHVSPDRFARDQAVDVPVDRPTRRIVVSHPSYNDPVEMRLYDPTQPLIAFTTDGAHVPISQRLPRGELVVVQPTDVTVLGEGSLAPRVTAFYGPPSGWSGWGIHQWDLSETDAVRVQHRTHPPVDFSVGKRELPYLYWTDDEPLDLLDGVFHERLPVLGSRPYIALPPLGPHDAVPWTVKCRRSGAHEWIVQGSYSPEELEAWELFSDETELLGRFDISVTGPEGARFDQSVYVAEGLKIEYDDDVRLPQDDGMTEFGATISTTSSSLHISPQRLEFDPRTSSRQIRLTSGPATATLTVRPPRLEFRLTPVGALPTWSDRRIGIRPEALSQATLAVRGVPDGVRLEAVVKDAHDRIQARLDIAERTRHGVLKISSDRLAPAAKSAQVGTLELLLHYPGDDGTWEAPLARFSTVGPRVRITADEDTIHVSGLATSEDVVVHIWQAARPWKPPISVPVVDGRAEIPESVLRVGPLRVAPVIEDAWDPLPAEPFPSQASVRLERHGDFGETPSSGLSRFLAGETPFPNVEASNFKIWHALAYLDRGLLDQHDAQFKQLAHVVCRHPRVSASSLAESTLSTSEKLALYIRTGLAFESLEVSRPGTRRGELATEPWLDMLVAMADLRRSEPGLKQWLLRHLEEIGGRSLLDILETGHDPFSQTVVDRNAAMLSVRPEVLKTVLAERKIVPGGLVDEATRYEGFFALFDLQHEQDRSIFTELYKVVMSRGFSPLRELKKFPALWRYVELRSDPLDGLNDQKYAWANTTFASLTLALFARLVAIGQIRYHLQQPLLEAWSEFARQEPVQSMVDLLLAEALVRHHCHPDIVCTAWRSDYEWADAVVRTFATDGVADEQMEYQ